MTESINLKVGAKIVELAPTVETKVIEALAERELTKRVTALTNAIDGLDKLEKQLKRLGPDLIAFDDKGAKTSEGFSKARVEERKKLQDQINKWTNAINKALEKKDFGDVYNFKSIDDKGGSGEKAE